MIKYVEKSVQNLYTVYQNFLKLATVRIKMDTFHKSRDSIQTLNLNTNLLSVMLMWKYARYFTMVSYSHRFFNFECLIGSVFIRWVYDGPENKSMIEMISQLCSWYVFLPVFSLALTESYFLHSFKRDFFQETCSCTNSLLNFPLLWVS